VSLTYVTLTADLFDGSGNLITAGTATFTPSAQLTYAGHEIVIEAPVTVAFNGTRSPSVSLLATDNASLLPSGWTWGVTFSGVPGNPAPFSFFLPATGGASQDLSSLSPVSSGTTFQGYLPLPSGTPISGQVPVATGSGEGSAWTTLAGSGTVTSVSVASANGFAGTVANPSTTPAISVQTSVTGLLKGNGTGVSAASAGSDYLAPAGNGSALTGITAAQVGADASGAAAAAAAASLPLAGGTMSGAIAMGAHKITGLTNGSSAQDAAAFGQLPSSSAPLPLAQGGTGTSAASANAAYNALSPMTTTGDIEYESSAGVASRLAGPTSATKQFLTSTGTGSAAQAPAWGTIAAGDVPVLNQNTTGTAAGLSASSALPNGTTATTQSPGDATTKVATTAYADAAVTVAEGLALPKAGGTMTGWLAPAVLALTFGASIAVNAALGNVFTVTLTASTGTLANPTNPVDGQVIRVRVIQDATGSRTLAYGTAYDFGSGSAPTLSTGASKVDVLAFEYIGSLAKWAYLGASFPQGF